MRYQNLSKTQIDRLGDRLRINPRNQEDLILLDEFRRSFGPAYQAVVGQIRDLKMKPTGRPEKSTPSVIEKLKRESIRLTQMQDIAGCRVILPDIPTQDRTVEALGTLFSRLLIIDRRAKPSYGYRAVHLVAQISGMPVEIQIRTQLQNAWAELSEKLADVVDYSIKYGGGPASVKDILATMSRDIASLEELEYNLHRLEPGAIEDALQGLPPVKDIRKAIESAKKRIREECEDLKLWFATSQDKTK